MQENLAFYKTLSRLLLKRNCAQTIFVNLIVVLLKFSSHKSLSSTQLRILNILLQNKFSVARYVL